MKRARDIERMVQDLRHPVDAQAHDRIVGHLLDTLKRHQPTTTVARQPYTGRIIMKSPMAKLAVAAVIIVAVVLGLFEFISTDSGSGVVWAEVAQKVQASGGLILRCTETGSVSLDNDDYAIKYFDPTHSRTDSYKDGQIVRSHYYNSETLTFTGIYHTRKHYLSTQHSGESEGFLEKQEDWTNPRYLVQRILSGEHRELEPQTIDGVLCEGLETSDPAVMGALPEPIDRLEVHMRLWVDAATEYPVRFEYKVAAAAEGQALESEGVMDQFQWDVEHDPSVFEPNIPPDYVSMGDL